MLLALVKSGLRLAIFVFFFLIKKKTNTKGTIRARIRKIVHLHLKERKRCSNGNKSLDKCQT